MSEFTINGFSTITNEELMSVDGGGWIRAVCCSIGAVGGGIIGWYTGGVGGIIAGVASGLACGDLVGAKIEEAAMA